MALKEAFRGAFTKNELVKAATVSLIAGEYVRVGEYKIQAGELVSLGYGEQTGQESAQGRIYMDLKDNANAAINGSVRLTVYSPQDRPIEIVSEYRTESLSTGAGDRTKQIPFSEHDLWVSEDKKVVLEFKSDTAATLDKSKSSILIDITKATV